jgi:hypothetical protein
VEYAVAMEAPGSLPDDPRGWCDAPWVGVLPAGRLAAVYFGSEFCEERIPGADESAALCSFARDQGLEAVLLTPIARPAGLELIDRLLGRLAEEGWAPSVVFSDWGVAALLGERHPSLPRRGGRLINRALRDPRVAGTGARPGNGARSSYVRELLRRTGATAVESDADLEGGFLGPAGEGLQRTVHLPYVFAASGRHCLLRAKVTGGHPAARDHGARCWAPCRGRWVTESRQDTELPLYRDGNTLLYQAPEGLALAHLPDADRIVLHRRPGS